MSNRSVAFAWLKENDPDKYARIKENLRAKNYKLGRKCASCKKPISDSGKSGFCMRCRGWKK